MTRFLDCYFWKLPQIQTSNFRKEVRQHTEVMVRIILWVLAGNLLLFQQRKNCENPLKIDKVIDMSLVYYFL